MVGMILCTGRHTVTAALRIVLPIAGGHFSDYHRLLSRARWSLWPVAKILAAIVLELVPSQEPVLIALDDTAVQHKGKQVWGKARHRDACRSTETHFVWLWGHKWVVLAILVKFPFASRRWALPVLMALYRSKELNQEQGRRHKTPIHLAEQLVSALVHWFPRRRFILLGDGGFASHHLARMCHRHRKHLTLVALMHRRANLYELPPKKGLHAKGRPRIKGEKLPTPEDVVAAAIKRKKTTVNWYGGGKRRVEFVTGTGQWYDSGEGLVPLRWVFVHDLDGTHRDLYFYSTDMSMSPTRIISLYTGRWSIEVTFQECRAQLGFHTPRSWTQNSVLRTVPCLLGLFSIVSVLYHQHHQTSAAKLPEDPWYHKTEATFGDAIATLRHQLWSQTILEHPMKSMGFQKLPAKLKETLLEQLCRAA
jgi:hypothetical protein